MAMLMMMRQGNYTNLDAIENVIRYITRTRKNETRGDELITWGGMGVGSYASPELVIEQFHFVQMAYGINKNGRMLYHETFNITDEEFDKLDNDYNRVKQIALECAKIYYSNGYQVAFAVHDARKKEEINIEKINKGVHIHFAVNAVNFTTGRKWHTSMKENFNRERSFNGILEGFMLDEPNRFSPFGVSPIVVVGMEADDPFDCWEIDYYRN